MFVINHKFISVHTEAAETAYAAPELSWGYHGQKILNNILFTYNFN